MAFMQTKSCCCGCDLRTGTSILVILIAILNGLFFCSSIKSPSERYEQTFDMTTGRSYVVRIQKNRSPIVIEVMVFVICAMAGYSIQSNRRMYLIPFMVMINGIFVVMLVLSLALLLAVVGIGSLWDSVSKDIIPDILNGVIHGGEQKNNVNVNLNVSIGPFTIVILILCLINIAIFLEFVRVVCSLFAEMGKPNGVILSQMASPMYYMY